MPFISAYCFLEDKDGAIWVGTTEGLFYQPPGQEEFRTSGSIAFEQTGEVKALIEDPMGNLLVGAKNGLFKKTNNGWSSIQPKVEGNIQYLQGINSLVIDNKDRIWIAGQQGLLVLDAHTYKINPKELQVLRNNNLDQENIQTLFIDREENLWIGTANNGLVRLFLSDQFFPVFRQNLKPFDGGTSENTIRSIWSDQQNIIWLGSYGGGLFKFDREQFNFENYRPRPGDPQSLSGRQVSAIFRDHNDIMWIGTWGDGLNKATQKSGSLSFERQALSAIPERDKTRLSEIQLLYEDELLNLWVFTNGGISKKSNGADQFIELTSYFDMPAMTINAHLEDDQGNWWLGTWNGLFVFSQSDIQKIKQDKIREKIAPLRSFIYDQNKSSGLTNSRITHVHQDAKGNIWVGTYGGGFNLWQPDKNGSESLAGSFKAYTQKNGLPNNVVYGILEDEWGRLWLSTNKGLSLFDPQTELFQSFTTKNGLQSDQFYFGAHGKTPVGEMVFGGNNGFNIFNPLNYAFEKNCLLMSC